MSGAQMTAKGQGNSMGRNLALFAAVAALFPLTRAMQSWNLALAILTMSLISAILGLGGNMQWGYAGLFSTGTMGFTALGGLAVVLVSAQPVPGAWAAGGPGIVLGLVLGAASIGAAILTYRRLPKGRSRNLGAAAVLILGLIVFRMVFDPAVMAVEANDPATAGNLGGLGPPGFFGSPGGGRLGGAGGGGRRKCPRLLLLLDRTTEQDVEKVLRTGRRRRQHDRQCQQRDQHRTVARRLGHVVPHSIEAPAYIARAVFRIRMTSRTHENVRLGRRLNSSEG